MAGVKRGAGRSRSSSAGRRWRPAVAEELPPEAELGAVAAAVAVVEAEVVEAMERGLAEPSRAEDDPSWLPSV